MDFFNAIRGCWPDWSERCQTEKFWEELCRESLKRRSMDIEQLHELAVKIATTNINVILGCAESPIEKIFMTWTYFAFFNYYPFCMTVLSPGATASLKEYYAQKSVVDEIAATEKSDHGEVAVEVLNQEEYANYALWDLLDPEDAIFVVPQAQLPEQYSKLKGMRFDYFFFKRNDERSPLIVECDGYEFHKDSFIKDRKRDRAIRSSSFEVMRFSGSEIYSDPVKVSFDILDYWKD